MAEEKAPYKALGGEGDGGELENFPLTCPCSSLPRAYLCVCLFPWRLQTCSACTSMSSAPLMLWSRWANSLVPCVGYVWWSRVW